MKKNMFLAFMLVLGLMAPFAQAVEDLGVVLLKQTPSPAEPGSNFDVEIELQNSGSNELTNIVIEIKPKAPLSLVSGESKKTFSRISAKGSAKISYTLQASSDALSGNYDLEFRVYKSSAPEAYTTEKVQIKIKGTANLILEDIYTNPSHLEPGVMADVNVKIKNVGTGKASSLQMVLNSSEEEIVPVLSGGIIYVGDLDIDESKDVVFSISISNNAEQKTYKTAITATYVDENNTASQKVFSNIGLPVTGSINLQIIKTEIDYSRSRVKIEIANKGTTEAKSVEARLVIGGETVDIDYTSAIKENKQTTFDFLLPGGVSGRVVGQLVIEYIGPGLEKNQIEKEIALDIEHTNGDGTAIGIVIIVIMIIVGYFLRKRYFKKKR